MAKPDTNQYVITGGLTDTGAPAYLAKDGSWKLSLKEAAVFEPEQQAQALTEAASQERTVCDPYAIPVSLTDNTIDPRTTRERIRAAGPSTRIRRPD